MKIDGSINPASADFIHNGIEKATREKAECIIIHLNTPGGLLKSTRMIVSDMLDHLYLWLFMFRRAVHKQVRLEFLLHWLLISPPWRLGQTLAQHTR
jgi:hypothetical protein